MDGTLVPTRDHTIAAQSKNYRYSTNHQVRHRRWHPPGGRDRPVTRRESQRRQAWEESGAKAAVGKTLTIADGGYPGTGLVIPHRRERSQAELLVWKAEHNKSHKQVRARIEHVFARMKTWKILRDCRLKGDGIHHAHARHRPDVRPRPRRMSQQAARRPTLPEASGKSFTGQPFALEGALTGQDSAGACSRSFGPCQAG
ncbi:transposase family protein [Streptomyces sp. NPDC097981]|uniref:transposase family protein n=1 Tax=Streptomyces sp. NPDC097981 TaxID=3155428 RepID=UPI0033329986